MEQGINTVSVRGLIPTGNPRARARGFGSRVVEKDINPAMVRGLVHTDGHTLCLQQTLWIKVSTKRHVQIIIKQ